MLIILETVATSFLYNYLIVYHTMKININNSFSHEAHDSVQHAGPSMHDPNDADKSDTTPQHFSSSLFHPGHWYAMVMMLSNPSIVGSSCDGISNMVMN
jgi:hypothetical protein